MSKYLHQPPGTQEDAEKSVIIFNIPSIQHLYSLITIHYQLSLLLVIYYTILCSACQVEFIKINRGFRRFTAMYIQKGRMGRFPAHAVSLDRGGEKR